MDPASLIPTPDTIPVHWAWFQVLLSATFFLHILVMNVMLGSSIIAVVQHLNKGDGPLELGREIGSKLTYAIAFTVNLGVAPLLFLQVLYGHFIYSSSVLMGWFWLIIIPLLICGYYLAYIYSIRYDRIVFSRTLLIGAVSVILLTIGFLMTNNMTLMQIPETWNRHLVNPTGFHLNLNDPELLPRYLHFVLSAIAVGGLAIALYYEYRRRRGDEDAGRYVQFGCRWFGFATIANFPVGLLFLDALPDHVHDVSTPIGTLFSVVLAVSILIGIFAVIMALTENVMPAMYGALGAVFGMTVVRDLSRAGYIGRYFSPGDLQLVPQYSPMFVFLAVFVAGLLLIGWMVKIAMQDKEVDE